MTAKHVPNDLTRKTVSNLATYFGRCLIAKYMGIDPKTLRKYYSEELKTAKPPILQVAATAYSIAIDDRNPSMCMFLLKTQGEYKEVKATEAEPEAVEDTAVGKIEIEVIKAKK